MMQNISSALIVQNGSILLVLEKGQENWKLPSAVVEEGYEFEDVAKNAALNTANINVEILQLFNQYQYNIDTTHVNHHVYECKITSGKLGPGEGIQDTKFFSMEEIKKIKVSQEVLDVVEEINK